MQSLYMWMEYPGDESSQDLQELSYRYALMPHIHDWEGAKLYGHALAFNTPLKVCEFGKQSGMFETEKSFVELVEEGLVLSSVTKTENDAMHIRLYNPTEHELSGILRFGFVLNKIESVRLDGKVKEQLEISDNSVTISVCKGKIYTLEVS